MKNAAAGDERKRFGDVLTLFRKYGDTYDMDYLLMLAQGFQESTLDQNAESHVGAIGIMQIMPATGKDLKVGDIHVLHNNVHAGVEYMRFMMDRYFKDEPMTRLDKGLFTFAAYKRGSGPRRAAAARGGQARARSQPMVQQRRAGRRRQDRRGNRYLRRQHLQVLHRLPDDRGRGRGARSRPRAASKEQATLTASQRGARWASTPVPI